MAFASDFSAAFDSSQRSKRVRDVLGAGGGLSPTASNAAQGAASPAKSFERSAGPAAAPRNPAARQTYAMGRFNALGWNPIASAAIVGGLMQESGSSLDTRAAGDAGTAFGIAQVRGDRLEMGDRATAQKMGLKDFAKQRGTDWRDFDTQIDFVDWELRNTEVESGRRLMKVESIDEAAFAMAGFERPKGWKGWGTNPQNIHGWENRLGNAKRQYGVAAAFAKGKNPDLPDVDVGDNRAFNEWVRGLSSTERGAVDLVTGEASPGTAPRDRLLGPARKGGLLGDILRGAGEGLAASGGGADIPQPMDFSAQAEGARRQAENGPLPSLGESSQQLFGGLFK